MRTLAAALFAWGMLGVTLGHAQTASDLAALRERAIGYWQAEVRKDYITSYQFFEPNIRTSMTLPGFVRGKRFLTVKGFSVKDIAITGDSALVKIAYDFEIEIPPPPPGMERVTAGSVRKEGVFEEHWIRLRGIWFRTTSAR